MSVQRNYKTLLLALVIASFIIRAFLASILELTNDEVNYWLYALYPALSHFDHPPMVGFFIQLTTANLMFDSEFFLRLSSVILGSFNTLIIFLIGKKLKDETAGLFASLLYNCSIYFFVIAGIFIQPDTPLVFFWLLALNFLVNAFSSPSVDKRSTRNILFAGIAIGLGMLSKYHAVYLWAASGAYVLFFDRKWLKIKELYTAVLISLVCFIPVVIWNIQNDFISFTFQGERVDLFKSGLHFDYFLTELFGQFFYNNPVNFILIIIVLIKLRRFDFLSNDKIRFMLLSGLPLLLIFLIFSLFRRTLPHWSGPGYISLILLVSAYLSEKYKSKPNRIPASVKISSGLTAAVLIFGTLQINYGIINFAADVNSKPTELGRNDVTLDMYGWKQAQAEFQQLNSKLVEDGRIGSNAPILAHKWYNAGHIDYYLARPLNKEVIALGRIDEIRNYVFVNKERVRPALIKEAYYISPSREYKSPAEISEVKFFKSIEPVDTIRVIRNGETVENVFVYIIKK